MLTFFITVHVLPIKKHIPIPVYGYPSPGFNGFKPQGLGSLYLHACFIMSQSLNECGVQRVYVEAKKNTGNLKHK